MFPADIAIRSVPPAPFLPLLGAPPATLIHAEVRLAAVINTVINTAVFQNPVHVRRDKVGGSVPSPAMRWLRRARPAARGERHAGVAVQAPGPPAGADAHRLRLLLPAGHRADVAARGERATGGQPGQAWWRAWNGARSGPLSPVDIRLEQTLGIRVCRRTQ